jgi:signal transduction histidine kinase
MDPAVVSVRALASRRPPPLAERGRGCQADERAAVALERDERRPDRDPADEVPRAVDRIDDPARVRLLAAALLAEEALAGAAFGDLAAERLLDGAVSVRDRRQVGLRVDPEVGGAEPRQRDRVGEVGELVREGKIRVDGGAYSEAWRLNLAVTTLQRHIMKLLVDDEATPLSELEGTMQLMFEYPTRAEAHERVCEALIELIDKGLAQLVYYDPPYVWENRTEIPPAAAAALLADPESWVSPLERIDSRQVRAASTNLGQRLFF